MDLSSYLSRLQTENNKVYDPIRKKWLVIQPEELVRQTLALYLIHEKKVHPKRLAIEKAIRLNNQIRRFDMVYYDHSGSPMLLVECKSPSTNLTDKVLEQAVWYNIEVRAPYLLLSNGIQSTWYQIIPEKKSYHEIQGDGPVLEQEK